MIEFILQDVLNKKNLTPKDLVEMAGLPRQTVRGLLGRDQARITTDTLNKLCKALDVLPGDLIKYTPD